MEEFTHTPSNSLLDQLQRSIAKSVQVVPKGRHYHGQFIIFKQLSKKKKKITIAELEPVYQY